MSVKFEKPTEDSLIHIGEYMREADRIEVMASHGMVPLEAVFNSVDISDLSSVALYNGVPCAVFGLVKRDLLTGTGVPWLLGTDDIDLCKKDFIIHTREGVREMLNVCPRLENHVHIENRKSIRWLKTMGFKFDEPEPVGIHGELFSRFYLELNNV
jgi:hypothetical protein